MYYIYNKYMIIYKQSNGWLNSRLEKQLSRKELDLTEWKQNSMEKACLAIEEWKGENSASV